MIMVTNTPEDVDQALAALREGRTPPPMRGLTLAELRRDPDADRRGAMIFARLAHGEMRPDERARWLETWRRVVLSPGGMRAVEDAGGGLGYLVREHGLRIDAEALVGWRGVPLDGAVATAWGWESRLAIRARPALMAWAVVNRSSRAWRETLAWQLTHEEDALIVRAALRKVPVYGRRAEAQLRWRRLPGGRGAVP